MYMSLPNPDGTASKENDLVRNLPPQEIEIAKALVVLEGKLSNEDYTKLWQELRHTGKDFDKLYENCKSGTFRFKDDYDRIKKTERLNDALRQHYYQALAAKKRHEEERDAYFQNDKKLIEIKENFIEETQRLALANSRYVEYNQRFTVQREKYIVRLLEDVSQVNEKNKKLKADRERLSKELSECRTALRDSKSNAERLELENVKLERSCKNLEKVRENMKKEAEWMSRQNKKLKDLNARLEQELASTKQTLESVKEERRSRDHKIQELESIKSDLNTRCLQQQQLVESLKTQIQQIRNELDTRQESWDVEREGIKEEITEMKKKLEKARANTHKTITRNQQLHEKLKVANHKFELSTAEKLRSLLKEKRTEKTNVELTSKQLELISEVLELKTDFFRDQKRIKSAAKVNKRLEATVTALRERMQILRKDPTAVIPMEDAQEYREMTRQQFMKDKLNLYSASTTRGVGTMSTGRVPL